jgi:predicted GH43/DUF377 family glycosyl hydrolase
MIEVRNEGIILKRTQLEFENEGVLNPAVIRTGDNVHLFYRAVRQGNNSTIGYCKLDGPLTVTERSKTPIIIPEFDYESRGVEDPRIVKIDDLYYLTYTAYDGINARGALAVSKDLLSFEKQGIIVPPITYSNFVYLVESAGKVDVNYYHDHKFYYQESDPEKKMMLWDKDVIFFPRKINNKLVFLHRIRPGIQLVSISGIKDLTIGFWDNYFQNFDEKIVLNPIYSHESDYIGGGCPPIETDSGWVLIYHGVENTEKGEIYSACAALLDLDNPTRLIARLPYALFSPKYDWELKGVVNNVVFPTGTALFGHTLFIYYGAADTVIGCVSVNLQDLVSELLTYKSTNEN